MDFPPELIIMIVSLIFGAVGIIQWQKGTYLMRHGKKAIAIVYKNVYESRNGSGYFYPVLRFLTDKQEWITQQLNRGFNPAKEEGSKIEVIYDPEEPEDFELSSSFNLEILPRVFIALGICGFIFGILEVFDVISMIE